MRSLPRCYKQDTSKVQGIVRQSMACKDVNTEAQGATTLKAVTRQQPVTI